MHQVVYISTAARGFDPAGLRDILSASRRNNRRDAVSGLLLFDGVRFMQALEGEKAAIERTFSRIKGDARHRGVVRLSEREVSAREFGEWDMAAEVSASDGVNGTIVEQVSKLVAGVPSATIRAFFEGFVKVRHAA